ENDAIVKRLLAALAGPRVRVLLGAFSQPDEIGHGVGRFLVEEPDGEGALGGLEVCKGTHPPIVALRTIIPPCVSVQIFRRPSAGSTGIPSKCSARTSKTEHS